MTKMFQMNVHIPIELNEQLIACANEQGITRSEFVRRSLKKAVKEYNAPVTEQEYETAYDSMTVELDMESRIDKLEKRMEEKESKGWIRRKLNI